MRQQPPLPDETRRTLDELISRYTLEPTLRDIYVEGAADVSLYSWVLGKAGVRDCAIYEIGTVQIPAAELEKEGLENSHRGRVIFLARRVEEYLGTSSLSATGVVDADLDHILGFKYSHNSLIYTEFTCIEMHLLDETSLSKFVHFALGDKAPSVSQLIADLSFVLQELFVFRLANAGLQWNLQAVEFDKDLTIQNGRLQFDVARYLRRYLDKNSRRRAQGEFEAECARLRLLLKPDIRLQAHGHDFTRLLTWYVREINKKFSATAEEFLARTIFLCLDEEAVLRCASIKRLLQRLRPHSG